MGQQKKIRDYGIKIGELEPGKNNSITDIKGVRVGHLTLKNGDVNTGVTAVLPHSGNIFKEKVLAVSHVINGYGKTIGTIQIDELGTIETPIILTNTLSTGVAAETLVEYLLDNNPEIGAAAGTVNPVVCECNDQYLNDIRGLHIKKEHIFTAISRAAEQFEQGAVGAGTGMSCYGLKGGIGSASRQLKLGKDLFHLGALVVSNFGIKKDLLIQGIPAGRIIKEKEKNSTPDQPDRGSIIIILATDLPLTERQLKRAARRSSVGLSRTGSYQGHGSGELVIAFTTAYQIKADHHQDFINLKMLRQDKMDLIFRAVAEVTEEAVLNSLICAETTVGKDGHQRYSLQEYIEYFG